MRIMKPQYFGDRNDFCKYAVLRCFERAVPRLVVCWMLTPDDKGFRAIDCELFCELSGLVGRDDVLSRFEETGLLGEATWFYNREFPNDRDKPSRDEYFNGLKERLRDDDLVFFDPDTGLEPESRRWGPEHLRWEELNRVLADERSVCVYQHRRHERKTVGKLLRGLAAAAPNHHCFALWPPPKKEVSGKSSYSSAAAFLVAAAPDHAEALSKAARTVAVRFEDHGWPLRCMEP
jgi:hypothetical protein